MPMPKPTRNKEPAGKEASGAGRTNRPTAGSKAVEEEVEDAGPSTRLSYPIGLDIP